ncbi:Crp/Fnr family transcriptional regulator [Parapedobacter tibetensis]|uniref:Crp/Fnr family transcriptional regulator n=1 Tax=Parapedobacter tibetensis TaxID=2972951 RepID=UPI00214DB6DF|nr:Crp/Fnr family transcriptional regulator [Parapedobacter tibetensis]
MQEQTPKRYYDNLVRHIESRISLDSEEKDYICSFFRLRKLLSKQYLLAQGDICRYDHYVCEGFLRSFYVDGNGNEHTLHFALEDWWISDLNSFLKQQPASRNIITLDASVLLQIDLENREKLMENVPKMERFWRILNENSSMAQDQRLLDTISMPGKDRYLALLDRYPHIEQRLPQKHIASFLGITPVFLSQIRKGIAKR